jgi:D-aspartate ligase
VSVVRSSRLPEAIILAPTDSALVLARSLTGRGVQVSFLAERYWRWITRTRWADAHLLGQLPADLEGWLSCLDQLARRGDGVLIPGTDRTSELLAKERSRIPANLRSFESPESSHRELIDKGHLYRLAERTGVRAPWTIHLTRVEELEEVCERATYPCLLKPTLSHQWRRLFGERRVLTVRGPTDLKQVARPALDSGLELLVTEHVPGPDSHVESAALVRRADGSSALRYGKRKLRSYPPGFGAGSLHESAQVPETTEMAEALLAAAEFVGLAIVEAKRHAETGEMVLIEANVRVTQSFGIGDAAGTDASWRLYSTLAGLPLPPQPTQIDGVRIIVPSLEPKAAVANLQERRISPRELIASYRGVRSLSGLSVADPGPAVRLIARYARTAGRFLVESLRRRRT